MEGKIMRVLLQNVPNGDEFLEQYYLHCRAIGYTIATEKPHHNSVSRIPGFQSYKTWGSQDWGLNKSSIFQRVSIAQKWSIMHCAEADIYGRG